MKLRRLRLENFKRFVAPLVLEDFADGLNLFAAPNEAGKSTVAEAVRAAFFERHRSGSVEHLRPWSDTAATPTVELEFDLGGRRHRLLKAFLGKRRCELHIEGQPPLDGAAAEDHLAQLLGFRFPGKGASAPEHMGIPGLLWIRQGTSHELTEPVRHAAEHLRQVLGDALGELTASTGDALLRTVEAARHELLTPKGGEPRGEYATAVQRVQDLTVRAEALARDIAAYQGRVDRLAELRQAHARDEREQPWTALRTSHRAAEAALAGAVGLEARLQTERTALTQWQTQATALRGELEALARDERAVEVRRQALTTKTGAESAAQTEALAWARRHDEAQQAEALARQRLEQAREAAARGERARALTDLQVQMATLAQTLQQARDAATRLATVQSEAQALAVPAAALQRLRRQAESLRDAEVQLQAAATVLTFDLAEGQSLRLGEEEITGQQRRTLVQPGVVHIPGKGTVAVQPGGADTATWAARREALQAELRAQCQALGVVELAEAEERARQAAQREAEARAAALVLQTLAPQGLDALQAEWQARSAREAALREALAPAAEGAGAIAGASPDTAPPAAAPDLDDARAAAERAATALAAASTSLNAARVTAGRAQSDRETAQKELAAAEATAGDPQRLRRATEARRDFEQALAHEATARERVEATVLELQRVNLTLLRQDVERLDRSARQLEQQHAQRAQEITRLEVELETLGALGLDEQRAECEREREGAVRRHDELARRAAALDHLLNLLREQRAALARRLQAPLQKHLDHVLGILFPGATLEVGDDLSPGLIRRPGRAGGGRLEELGRFDELSVGTREQMGIVARLAYADLLQEAGRPTLLILDDALVHTDEDRLGRMKRVLYDAAQRHQVLIFTCHPAAWRDLGVVARALPGPG